MKVKINSKVTFGTQPSGLYRDRGGLWIQVVFKTGFFDSNCPVLAFHIAFY